MILVLRSSPCSTSQPGAIHPSSSVQVDLMLGGHDVMVRRLRSHRLPGSTVYRE